MSPYIKYFSLMLALSGCALFKDTASQKEKTNQVLEENSRIQSREQKDWLSKSASLEFSRRTDSTELFIQIWPRGIFTYSPDQGFIGEADQVVVARKQNGTTTKSLKASDEIQDRGTIQINEEHKKKDERQKLSEAKQTSVSWKWVLSFSIIFVFVIVYLKIFKK